MINFLHLKYIVAIAECGSLNKAAEELLVAQPNLSRVVKDMEAELDIQIFRRSSKGVRLTSDGELFIRRARKILNEVEKMEHIYTEGSASNQEFSISAPRASYISDAFMNFSKQLTQDGAEIFYHETNALEAVNNILKLDYHLGIIRYASTYDRYFKRMLEEKGLEYEQVAEFNYVLVMHREHPLAGLEEIHFSDLDAYIQIAHADPYVPSLSLSAVKEEELPAVPRRIFVFERGSQLDLLSENRETFMWVSPLPARLLERFDLVQRRCAENRRKYRDVLIYRKDYQLSELDKKFITALAESKRECIKKNA